jgi:hypothetical protein
MGALKLQEIVVAAMVTVGILAAYRRTCCIDGAAALVLVKEHAGALVNVILAMPQDPFICVFGLEVIRKFLPGCGLAQFKVPGKPFDIRVSYFDTRMAATVARTLGTIKMGFHNSFRFFHNEPPD